MWNTRATQDAVAHAGSDADWRTSENGFSPVHHVSSDQQTRLLHTPSQPLLYALPTTEAGRLYMGSSFANKNATEVDPEQQAYTLLSREGFARGREPYAASENREIGKAIHIKVQQVWNRIGCQKLDRLQRMQIKQTVPFAAPMMKLCSYQLQQNSILVRLLLQSLSP